MQNLKLQTLLRKEGLAGLEAFRIRYRRHTRYSNLVCLKYSQQLSPMERTVVQQSRGIVLDEADDWAVVSRSYDKFFNLGESLAADIDWESAVVEEKLDGSLMVLYPYDGQWQVQSSGTADASGTVYKDLQRSEAQTYAELFWQTWEQLGYALPPLLPYSLAFELMTPENRVVVHHERPRLVMHGVRNLETGLEEHAGDFAAQYGYEAAREFPLTQEGLRAAANGIPAHAGEGFVVRDARFRRVKVKSEQYVQWSHLKEGWSDLRAWEVLLSGEVSEVTAYFPDFGKRLDELGALLYSWVVNVEDSYKQVVGIENQKEFALAVKDTPYAAPLFALRSGKSQSALAWLTHIGSKAQEHVLRQLLNQEVKA